MITFKVNLKGEIAKAADLVRAATKCDFDIDVKDERLVVDGKSLLGVISLSSYKGVCFVDVVCHVDDAMLADSFKEEIKNLLIE